jgi:hypothetical protein
MARKGLAGSAAVLDMIGHAAGVHGWLGEGRRKAKGGEGREWRRAGGGEGWGVEKGHKEIRRNGVADASNR